MDDLVKTGLDKTLVIGDHGDGEDASRVVLEVSHFCDADVFSCPQPITNLRDGFSLFFETAGAWNAQRKAKHADPARLVGGCKQHVSTPGLLLPVRRSQERLRP